MKSMLLLLFLLLPMQAAAAPLTRVIFYTDWKAQAEHGGFYAALALGYYRQQGLEVIIRPGGPQTDNVRLLAAGAVDLAMVSDAFQATTLATKGAQVKIVMASFQKDPEVIMAHPGKAPVSLAAWSRRPIYMDDGFKFSYWPWLMARFGFHVTQARSYAFSLTPWLNDKNALQEGYLSSEPYTARKAGVAPELIVLADAGYPGYAGMVAASSHLIATKPDVVRAFVQASQAGWKAYLTGVPTAANQLIKRDNPAMTDDLLAFARQEMIGRGMVLTGDARTQGAGTMTAARWQQFYQEMAAIGLYPKNFDPKSIYDLRFLSQNGDFAKKR